MKSRLQKRLAIVGLAAMVGLGIYGCGESEQSKENNQMEEDGTIGEPEASLNTETDHPEEAGAKEESALTGDVYEIGNQKFILNKAIVEEDENGGECSIISVPVDEAQMDLVTVLYDEDTIFYKRTIRDGGASYEDSESSAEELEKGRFVELWGSYEDETFHATEIQIVEVI